MVDDAGGVAEDQVGRRRVGGGPGRAVRAEGEAGADLPVRRVFGQQGERTVHGLVDAPAVAEVGERPGLPVDREAKAVRAGASVA